MEPETTQPTTATGAQPVAAPPVVDDRPAEPVRQVNGLHAHVLGDMQVLAQSVSGIAPSIAAGALVPLAFADAGSGAWFTVLIATIGILCVGICVTELAVRHVSTGALYTLVPKGLGPAGGLVTGVMMIINTVVSGPFLALGFGIFLNQFLGSVGLGSGSPAVTIAVDLAVVVAVTVIAYLDIRISTRVLLAIEAASMTAISLLLVIVLAKHGAIFDRAQLALHGTSAHGMLLGIVFLVLSFGTFEGATALGVEARRPRRGVRLAVLGSVILAGLFFVVNAYVQVLGFSGTGLKIASQSAPLNSLADHYGVSWLGDLILLGVAFSFFGALNAWLNYIPRMVFAMGSDRVLPRSLSRAHPRTGSPYIAILSWSAVWLLVLVIIFAGGINQTNAFNDFGAFSGYFFTLVYLLVALAAPVYLMRAGTPSLVVTLAALVGGAVMGIEFYFSFIPMPASPLNFFVYAFAASVAATLVGSAVAARFAPGWFRRIGTTEEPSVAAAGDVMVATPLVISAPPNGV